MSSFANDVAPITSPSPWSNSSGSYISGDNKTQTYILYFIRHGEALHNQLEKQAQSSALSMAVSQGHDPKSSYVQQCVEEARNAILHSDSMEDPPLSDLGVAQAKRAKRDLERLIDLYELPPPEEVWVSPLQRTLQSAAIIFPNSSSETEGGPYVSAADLSVQKNKDTKIIHTVLPKIKVRKEIEERRTGLPCDKHSSLGKLTNRPTFNRFSFSALKISSMANIFSTESSSPSLNDNEEEFACHSMQLRDGKSSNGGSDVDRNLSIGSFLNFMGSSEHQPDDPWDQEVVIDAIETSRHVCSGSGIISNATSISEEEDKMMLRERTKKLLTLLTETESRSIALIGHKGYLRELERGPLGHADADLFANCEVRVYRLALNFCIDTEDDRGAITNCRKYFANGTSNNVPIVHKAEKIASSRDND